MKVYLASQFCRQNELKEYRDELKDIGIEVISSWIDEEQSDSDVAMFQYYARADKEDIKECDIFILFTGPPYYGSKEQIARGGRHHEAGFAEAIGKKLLSIGPLENIFHYDNFLNFSSWDSCIRYLANHI